MIRFFGIIFMAVGLYVMACSLFNWERFWALPRNRLWAEMLGRKVARVYYGIAGLVILVAGAFLAAGV